LCREQGRSIKIVENKCTFPFPDETFYIKKEKRENDGVEIEGKLLEDSEILQDASENDLIEYDELVVITAFNILSDTFMKIIKISAISFN
jgi:hypothetical protein